MKISRKQFDKAMRDLPKLREAEATVKAWDDGLKSLGAVVEYTDVLEIRQSEDGKVTYSGNPKEVPRVAGQPVETRKAAG